MFPTLVRRLAQASKPQVNVPAAGNPIKLKKVWPPDFKSMSPQQQLRFEKKYKRRLKLATARPRWDKFVRLTQLCSITCTHAAHDVCWHHRGVGLLVADLLLFPVVVSYMVLWMDWKDIPTPFGPVSAAHVLLSFFFFSSGIGRL